jgi:hypothetical protein
VSAASTTITVTPHYANCTATPAGGGAIAATIDINGCDFEFSALTYTAAEDTSHGTAEVKCPTGTTITLTIATCQIHINPQHLGNTPHPSPTIGKSITITNRPAGNGTSKPYVNIHTDVTTVHYLETDGFLCPFSGDTTGTDGRFKSTISIKIARFVSDGTHVATGGGTHARVQYNHDSAEKAIHVK